MFNRGQYNNLNYNRGSTLTSPISAYAGMVMKTSKANHTIHKYDYASSNMAMKSMANGTIEKTASETLANMKLNTPIINPLVGKYGGTSLAAMIMKATADHILSGEEIIALDGIILRVGEELEIDTCNMTITINGVNAMKYLEDKSKFFELNQGLNEVIYTDQSEGNQKVIDVLYKDRWL